MRGDSWCEYPRCDRGRVIGAHHCARHFDTPFTTQAEINAYRRGRRYERRDGGGDAIAWITALLSELTRLVPPVGQANHCVSFEDGRLSVFVMRGTEWHRFNFDPGDEKRSPAELAADIAKVSGAITGILNKPGKAR